MIIKFCEDLLSRLRERQAIYVRSISSGNFDNFEEYKLSVGKLKGLEESEFIVKELYKNMFEGYQLKEGENENVSTAVKLY